MKVSGTVRKLIWSITIGIRDNHSIQRAVKVLKKTQFMILALHRPVEKHSVDNTKKKKKKACLTVGLLRRKGDGGFVPFQFRTLEVSYWEDSSSWRFRPTLCLYKYEGHFRSNITVPVTSLCMIQFSKTIPQFVRLYITYKMVKSETKMHVELEDTRLYIR